MSYSICNVLKEAGIKNILRWVPFEIEEADLRNRLRNKMIRPTTIPQTLQELMVEHAVAREALRLAFEHHKALARGLRGIQRKRTIADIFEQTMGEETHIKMMELNFLGGTGGLLSHAPRRAQSALMLIDGFQPEGVTKLAQDSVFMMPHLGVLSTVHPKAAVEIFEKDCLVRLGTCIAPVGEGKSGETAVKIIIKMPEAEITEDVPFGTIRRVPLKEKEAANVKIEPHSNMDVGAGKGRSYTTSIEGGVVGIIVDARGRPLVLPEDTRNRSKKLIEWFRALDAYPQETLTKIQETL